MKLLLFALPVAGLAMATEHYLKQAPSSYRVKDESLRRRADEIQILIFGSSHAAEGMRPDMLPAAFNLADSSQSLLLDEQLFRRYLPALPHLRLILVTISEFSLDYRLSQGPEPWRAALYRRFYGIGEDPGSWNLYSRFGQFIPLYCLFGSDRARAALWTLFRTGRHEEFNEDGWLRKPRTDSAAFVEATGPSRARFVEKYLDRRWRLKNVEALYRILAMARERGIVVVFVTLPVYKSYAKAITPGIWASAMWTIRSICRQTHSRYFNHFQNPSFYVSDFVNSDHLNEDGASKITRILAAELGLAPAPPSQI